MDRRLLQESVSRSAAACLRGMACGNGLLMSRTPAGKGVIMAKHMNLGGFTKSVLAEKYRIKRNEIGEDARLTKFGMVFTTRSYEVKGAGHLCIMRMKAFGGIMKMETVVIAPYGMDAPLMNVDWVGVLGKETLMVEFYDSQLSPWPDELQAEFRSIASGDADLADRASGAHWYDSIRYSCSYDKSGKGLTERFNRTAQAYIRTFCRQLSELPGCTRKERQEKRQRIGDFAGELYAQGGPAVDMITKLFGRETAKRVIMRHLYGV